MGLIVKPPSWGHCTTNLTGTPSGSGAVGTSVIAGANNADTTQASLLANITHDVEYLVIGIRNYLISGGNGSCLLDILIDPAGGSSWAAAPLINDLLVGEMANVGGVT